MRLVDIDVKARINRELSLDPSYIVHYQVFEAGRIIGEGAAQYHREAGHNDIAIPEWIKRTDGSPLPDNIQKKIKEEIHRAAVQYINQRPQF